jgi:hypothetical protein
MPWAFLVVTLIGALFTFNAYVPHKRTGPFIIPSFFAGWLTSELSGHHFAWQVVATIFFVWAGALEAWPGWAGLGITMASWAGLLALVPISRHAEPVVEAALRQPWFRMIATRSCQRSFTGCTMTNRRRGASTRSASAIHRCG